MIKLADTEDPVVAIPAIVEVVEVQVETVVVGIDVRDITVVALLHDRAT